MERDKDNEALGTARNRQTLTETGQRETDRGWVIRVEKGEESMERLREPEREGETGLREAGTHWVIQTE